jgi:drug/metabolite transporter (DMT)-like permease
VVAGKVANDRSRFAETTYVTRSRAFGIAAAIFYIFLWASAYVPSKIGVLDSSPMWFLVIRFGVSGAIALVVALALGARFPRDRAGWIALIVLGILSNAAYLGLTYEALRHLASGLGAIVASTNPIVLAIVAPYFLREPLTRMKVVGMLLGFGGVIWIVHARLGTGSANISDVALAFMGVVASIAGTIIFKRYLAGIDLRAATAVQLLAAGVFLLPFALIGEGAPHVTWTTRIIVSFLYLSIIISIGATALWLWLLKEGDASRVTSFFFLTPIFGLLISFVFLHEAISVQDIFGLAAIALGITLVQRS